MVIIDQIDAAIGRIGGDDRSSRLRRNSLLVLREKYVSSAPPLRVEVGPKGAISATELATVTRALQDATARAALLILHPKDDRVRLTPDIRERARLIPRSQSGNTIFFDFPRPVAEQSELLSRDSIAHLAEEAVRELIEVLPENPEDRGALTSLPGRRTSMRAAVKALADAVNGSESLAMTLSRPGRDIEYSVLTREQAREVPDLLSGYTADEKEVAVRGLMDGMRTRRRLFYILDEENGKEYPGSIEPDQLDVVQAAMGHLVEARLKQVIRVRADGSRSHPVYSLLSLHLAPEL